MPPHIISSNLADIDIPGVVIEVDAETAARMGAFEETGLSEADALDANADLPLTELPESAR